MEEKNNIGMKHAAHEHSLILNENYIAKEGDVCSGCLEQIDSCKSFVYSCSNITSSSTSGVENLCVKFLLHKICAELPSEIVNPIDPKESLFFNSVKEIYEDQFYPICCQICGLPWKWFPYCRSNDVYFYVCFKCVVFQAKQSTEDHKFVHAGHGHPLALIEQPSSFKCHACKVNDNILDLSYRCTKCQFWMHKSCGDAPHSFRFQFHEHHLILSFSLPQIYHKFVQHCRLCNGKLSRIEWLYCCRRCRFFTHFQCARSRSSPMLSSSEHETYHNLVHLPAADELSLNLLLEQFVKDYIILDKCNNKNNILSTNHIKHWTHEEHVLKLITSNELYEGRNDDEILLVCEGCVKPIRSDEGVSYYGCVPCKYFMHKGCAELPREMEHHLWPGKTLYANKYSEAFKLFWCDGCGVLCNGIFYGKSVTPSDERITRFHIGCVTLPKIIKHEAHHHQLDQVYDDDHACNACTGSNWRFQTNLKHRCEKCNFYICTGCITHARTFKHGWDPHPLDLIYEAGMVADHEHEFDCECCSREINTNTWFYHCSKCDLSFDPDCLEKSSYRLYKYVKFGATDINRDKLHPHRLTFVLNKKVRRCENCGQLCLGRPVLQCAPCNVIFCHWCCD